jgi:hypothetical protein
VSIDPDLRERRASGMRLTDLDLAENKFDIRNIEFHSHDKFSLDIPTRISCEKYT